MHQNVPYAAPPPPVPSQLHPRHPPFPRTPAPPPSRPHPFFGFSPPSHHPQHAHLQRELAPVPREPEPSLTLSLLQQDASVGIREKHRIEHSFPPPRPPSSVRAFDLEQPLHHADQSDHSMRLLRSTGNDQIAKAPSLQQPRQLEHPDSRSFSLDNVASSEQVDRSQFQEVPASELAPHVQSDEPLYPLPVATHDAVVQDKDLFISTLEKFLAALGTRLTVPKFAGKDMDLHAIYREVTMRGGLEQVIRYALWNELVMALNILIPSLYASFVLRKHYTNLLYHFEQVYYFRAEGHLRSPPVPILAPNPVLHASDIGSPYEIRSDIGSSLKKSKKKLNPLQIFGVDPAASVGTNVTGSINGKFEEGYVVTMVVGTEKVTGVLYHAPVDNNIQQFASVPSLVGSKYNSPGLEIQLQGKKKKDPLYKKDSLHKKDPNAPRRTRTGYNIFFKEQRARLRQIYPEKDRKVSRMVIEMWSRLPGDEKSLYVERGQKDRERYRKELLEYQERTRQQAESDHAGQPLAEQVHADDASHDYHVSLDMEGDMMSYQGAQPQVSEMDDELQPGQGYPVDEDGAEHNVKGPLNGDVGSEQSFGMPENLCKYPDEPGSEKEADPGIEEAFPADADETTYPDSEKCDNGQEEGNTYPVSNEGHHLQDDGILSSHMNKAHASETNIHGGYTVSEQPYYMQDQVYAYPSSLHHQVLGSGGLISSGQVVYRIQGEGQVYHPHLPQSHPGTSASGLPQQQHYGRDRYIFAPIRNVQAFEAEALGVPVPSNQAGYRGQNERLPYSSQLQLQTRAVDSNVQTRPLASEQIYQPRFPYPMDLHYTQANHQPHAYLVHVPNIHGYSVHLPETQAPQNEHAVSSHADHPQVMTPEISGTAASSQQVYPIQDGGHTYHA